MISRQDLEAIRGDDDWDADFARIVLGAIRAILDAPPLEWCEAHRSNQIPDSDECWAAESFGTPCQFATYVRVKVGP